MQQSQVSLFVLWSYFFVLDAELISFSCWFDETIKQDVIFQHAMLTAL